MRSGFVGVLLAAALACRGERAAPAAPEVALFSTVGDAPAAALSAAAARAGVARVRRVAAAADADVLWLGDPTEAVEAEALLLPGAVALPEGVDSRFGDPRGRWAPLCARALVLVVAPGAALPLDPVNVRDAADPRLAARVAVGPPGAPGLATPLAALGVTYGEASLRRFLALLARNRTRVAESERAARALVASGEAAVALLGSEEAAAGAASAAALEVVVPDQQGRGAVVLPTAVAVAQRAAGGAAAARLATWLVGAEAEALLAARAPGFMPLRAGVPVPVGVRPAGNVVALPLDWDRLAAEKRRLAPLLAAWPP
ncbi:ABC transporter substrate-binding protein [Anaeromyxobacter diazotrophicus]|uniref:ABC transporter substrate-binding protein n=1 Tax=Anaeromyxobacter diazotrophicus TaxID=2590199 RepID=UPI00158FD95A|nr:ABC transporter substrate-binding protein [Anaeromyxobacter diazotrophicus]